MEWELKRCTHPLGGGGFILQITHSSLAKINNRAIVYLSKSIDYSFHFIDFNDLLCLVQGVVKRKHFFLLFMQVILGPEKMITIPPRHYCIVENPVLRDKDGRVLIDANGQIKLGHADQVRSYTWQLMSLQSL